MFIAIFVNIIWLIGAYSLQLPSRLFAYRRGVAIGEQTTTKLWTTVVDGSGKSITAANLSIPPLSYSVFGENVPKVDNKPLFARLVSWVLKRLVESRTQFVSGLQVDVLSANRDLIRGRVDTLELKFDKIAFGQIFISGGGRLILRDLDLRMRRFLFQDLQSLRRPYRIYGDFLLTQSDIVNSKFIRNLLQLLVNTILERSLKISDEILKVNIKKVSIRQRRLFAQGEVSTSGRVGAGASTLMNFEVSTGAGIRDDGQVIFLRDIQVVLNPDSILRTSVPILLSTPIDVDLGEDCRVESLVIANRHIWVRANSVISPISPFAVTPVSSKALYRFDLAALLSNIIKIPAGIAVPFKGWFRRVNGAMTAISSSLSPNSMGVVDLSLSGDDDQDEPEEDETPSERFARQLRQKQQQKQAGQRQQQLTMQTDERQRRQPQQIQEIQEKAKKNEYTSSQHNDNDEDEYRPRAMGREPAKGPRNTLVIRPSVQAALLLDNTGVVEDKPQSMKSPLPLSLPLSKSLPLPRPMQAP